MADVFVSYAREDRDRVEPIIELLEKQGWSVWWDREIVPGDSFERVIDQAILKAKCVVVIWTDRSVQSEWVQAEAGDGLDRGILVPILLDPVRLPLAFRRQHVADFSAWPEPVHETDFNKLLNSIEACVSDRGQKTRLTTSTLKKSLKPVSVANQGMAWRRATWVGLTSALVASFAWVFTASFPDLVFDPDSQPGSQKVSLAIKPFQSTGSSTRTEGLEYELERQLNQLPNLAVRVDSDPGGKTDYLITGAFQGSILSVKLSDEHGARLWSSTLNLASHPTEAVTKITTQIRSHLGLQSRDAKRYQSHLPPKAYQTYLRAYALYRKPHSPNNLKQASGYFLTVLQDFPDDAASRAGLCETYLSLYLETRREDYIQAAEPQCHRAQTLDNRNSDVYLALGLLYSATGQNEKSLQQYRTALELTPYSTDAMRGMGSVLNRMGESALAEQQFQNAVRVGPDTWTNHDALGSYLFNAGRWEEAAQAYQSAAMLTSEKARPLANVGASYFMAEKFESAVEFWQRSARINPQASVYSNLGSAYYFLRQFRAASDKYLMALEMAPGDYRFAGHVGDALFQLKDPEYTTYFNQAIDLARLYLKTNPSDHSTLASLAGFEAALGNRSRAEQLIRKASQGFSSDIYVLYDIAVAQIRLGETEQARKTLSKLIGLGYSRNLITKDASFDPVSMNRIAAAKEP